MKDEDAMKHLDSAGQLWRSTIVSNLYCASCHFVIAYLCRPLREVRLHFIVWISTQARTLILPPTNKLSNLQPHDPEQVRCHGRCGRRRHLARTGTPCLLPDLCYMSPVLRPGFPHGYYRLLRWIGTQPLSRRIVSLSLLDTQSFMRPELIRWDRSYTYTLE